MHLLCVSLRHVGRHLTRVFAIEFHLLRLTHAVEAPLFALMRILDVQTQALSRLPVTSAAFGGAVLGHPTVRTIGFQVVTRRVGIYTALWVENKNTDIMDNQI